MTAITFPHHDAPVASILILAWRQHDALAACLRALAAVLDDRVPYEVVLVLNGASDDVRRFVASAVTGARVVDSGVNLGFAGGCNRAADHARGRYLMLLNDDAMAESGWLSSLVEVLEQRPEVAAVGGCILFPDGTVQEAGSIIWNDGSTMPIGRGTDSTATTWQFAREVDYVSACSLLVRAEAWRAVGGMDQDYWPAYYEDVDLCLALRERGWSVFYEPRSRVRHFESSSSAGDFKSFLFKRNKARLREKWAAQLDRCEPAVPTAIDSVVRAVWRARRCPRRMLIVDDRVPVRSHGSGFGRMVDATVQFAAAGYAVTLFATGGVIHTTDHLITLGIRVLGGDLEAHLQLVHELYDVVIVSRPHNFDRFGRQIRRHQPQAALIYDCEALFWRRVARQATVAEPADVARLQAESAALRAMEEAIVRLADATVTVSEDEAAVLREVPEHCAIAVLPPLEPGIPFSAPSFHQRHGVGFVAGWMAGSQSPNGDGLRWFVECVLPAVQQQIPWVRIRVSGADPPDDLVRLSSPNLTFEGLVPDLRAFYDELRVVIVPLRFGAGVKLKAIEALQHGVPVVATAVGAEGIETRGHEAIVLADTAAAFAAALVALLTDAEAWERQRAAIRALTATWQQIPAMLTWPDVIDGAIARRHRVGQPLLISDRPR